MIDSTGAAGDQFGRSVAISGDKVIAGAPLSDASVSTPLASNLSDDRSSFAPTAINHGAAIFFVNAPLAPTAASVTISGRVITPQNLGLTGALVTLTDSRGEARTIRTGKHGNFRFTDVAAGETYILSVTAKRYRFTPQVITVTEDVTDIVFTPN